MDKALLDTDMLSEILKGVDRNLVARAAVYRAVWGRYTVSTVTVVEVVKGMHKVGREDAIERFVAGLSSTEMLPLDSPSAVLAGRIYGDLERTGQTIGRADPMIAAMALRHGLTLVSGNLSHYRRIQALGYGLQRR